MGILSYRSCWHRIRIPLFLWYCLTLRSSSQRKELYTPKSVFIHVTSLRQAFAHCGRFSTAASRRSMARVAVPFLGIALSRPLPVIDLVSLYLANYLIGRRPFLNRIAALLLLRSAFHLSFGRTSLACKVC